MKLPVRTTVSIQSRMEGDPEGQWMVRNELRDLNFDIVADKKSEPQVIEAATRMMNSWYINYPQSGVTLRVHLTRK